MIRVGLIGEDPNDTQSIKNLLSRKYGDLHFHPMLKGVKGHQLDHVKTARAIAQEMKTAKCKLIIFIRDLDGAESQSHLVKIKKDWFKKNAKNTDVLLLNIWELEALMFADIDTFNKEYGCNINFKGDPMRVDKPKEKLKEKTSKGKKKYHESHAPDVFNLLQINQLSKNCKYFKDFLAEFTEKVSA